MEENTKTTENKIDENTKTTENKIEEKPEVKPQVKEKTENVYKIENMNELINGINTFSNALKETRKENIKEISKQAEMHLGGENKNCIVDENNKKLDNYEIFKRSLKLIENDKNKKNLPFSNDFINYMKDYIKNVDNKGSQKDFMDENITKEFNISILD